MQGMIHIEDGVEFAPIDEPGYHGTTRDRAEEILDQQEFEPSKGLPHYGHGVYFFIDWEHASGPDQARDYCEYRAEKNDEYGQSTILQADLCCAGGFDIIDNEGHRELFSQRETWAMLRAMDKGETIDDPWMLSGIAALRLKDELPEMQAIRYENHFPKITGGRQRGVVINVTTREERRECIKNIKRHSDVSLRKDG